jgi:hypothetical protein
MKSPLDASCAGAAETLFVNLFLPRRRSKQAESDPRRTRRT